jgi:branched-subunit amino acid transport protein
VPAFHQALGGFVILLNLVAGTWAVLVVRGRLQPGRAFEQVLALSHTVIIGQALIGLLLLASKHRAPVQLHYVYGLAPAVAVVFAYSARSDDPRRNEAVFAIVAFVAALFAARAFMTGAGLG